MMGFCPWEMGIRPINLRGIYNDIGTMGKQWTVTMVWLCPDLVCPDLVCPDLVCIRKLTFLPFNVGKMRMNLGILGFPLFKHPHLPLFFAMEKPSGGWFFVVGAGNICEVPPRNPRNCRCFTTPSHRMPTSRTSPRRGSSCRRTVCRSSGMPCEPFRETVHWAARLGVWKGITSLGSEEKQGSDKLGYGFVWK